MAMPFSQHYADYDGTLPRFRAAGVDVVSLTIQNMPGADLATATAYLARVRAEIARRADQLALCTSVAEIQAARVSGRLALLLNHQDGSPLGAMPEMVDLYHALGIRSAYWPTTARTSWATAAPSAPMRD
jgi:membrane dipeptidase